MEHIRAHMGLGVHQDALRRAAGRQLLQDPPVPDVSGAGVQLPVGKGPGAALAELYVGLRVQHSGAPEGRHVPLPGHGVLPPLQHDGPQAAPGQNKGREQAPRTGPDDHRRRLGGRQGLRQPVYLRRIRRHPPVPDPPQCGLLLPQGHRRRIDKVQLLPGVDGPAQHLKGQNVPLRHPQQPGGLAPQQLLILPRSQLQPLDPDHGLPPPFFIECSNFSAVS